MQGSVGPFLSASDLACRRGDRLLFRGLSFALTGGEALHITGANGTGKTTLIRALAGLNTPFAGEVRREGEIGLLDERPALDPNLTLGKALAFWEKLDTFGDPGCQVEALGLVPLLEVPVRYLSTGQRKRAAFAVLHNWRPPIWLLDEPLSGLDHSSIEFVSRQIEAQLKAGGIALIASHQPLVIEGLKTLAIEDFAPQPESAE